MAGSIRVAGHTIAQHDIVNDKIDIQNATLDSTNTFNFANDSISGDKIDGGTISNFASTGIDDNASSTAITIDSSGKVGVGTVSPDGKLDVTSANYDILYLNRTSVGSASILFRDSNNDGALIQSLSGSGGGINFFATSSGTNIKRVIIDGDGHTKPGADNTYDLGTASYYWNDGYIYNGVTTGSDGRQKQDIEELSEAEQRVAIACKGLLRKFRWKDMVAEKGDDARIHFGIIAQDLKAAFEAEGLDAGRYGMFIHSEWWETEETYTDDNGAEKTRINTFDTEEEAPEGAVKKDRMGIRYSELLAFIIAAI